MKNNFFEKYKNVGLPIGLIILAALFIVGGWSYTQNILFVSAFSSCEEKHSGEKRVECIERVTERTIRQHGLQNAVDIFFKYISIKKINPTSCHLRSHDFGHSVYNVYYDTISKDFFNFDIPEKFFLCFLGIYHGVTSHFIADKPDVSATEICERLKETAPENLRNKLHIGDQCYHGAGHGFALESIEKISETNGWGNFQLVVEKPLMRCRNLAEANAYEKDACAFALFSDIAFLLKNKERGFSYDTHDPFELCSLVNQEWRLRCLADLLSYSPQMEQIGSSLFTKTLSRVEGKDEQMAVLIRTLAVYTQGYIAKTNNRLAYKHILAQCEVLTDRFYEGCMWAVIKGVFDTDNNAGHRSALAFCKEPIFVQKGLDDVCYAHVIDRMRYFYPKDGRLSACADVPKNMQKRCRAENPLELDFSIAATPIYQYE